MKYTIKQVHISTIKHGDSIMHNGNICTVDKHNIKAGGMFGATLFGDSYRAGTKQVQKVIILRSTV